MLVFYEGWQVRDVILRRIFKTLLFRSVILPFVLDRAETYRFKNPRKCVPLHQQSSAKAPQRGNKLSRNTNMQIPCGASNLRNQM